MDKMKILITGGFGYIGQWIVEDLIKSGHDISVLSRNKAATITKLPVQHLRADISEASQCKQILKGQKFESIVHIASANNSNDPNYAEHAIKTNVLGTRNLLGNIDIDSLKNLIYISTFHVYGSTSGTITEESKVSPKNDYAATHYFAEEYIRQFNAIKGLPYTILRLTNSYGCPKTNPSANWDLLINDLARNAFKEKIIRLRSNAQDQRDFIWLGTVCEVINKLLCLNQAPNNTFNLSHQKPFRLIEIAQLVQQAYKEYSGENIEIDLNISETSTTNSPLYVDSTKINRIIKHNSKDNLLGELKDIFSLLQQSKL